MAISRREFNRLFAGAGALAAVGQLSRTASLAQTSSTYRAMVGVFLFGGNDGWNMVVPTDSRYAAYSTLRNEGLVLPKTSLIQLGSTAFGLHPSFAPLRAAWNEGALGVVLNAGSLFAPLTKDQYKARPDLVPRNLMSHADEQLHWQGNRMRDTNLDGFMGRMADKMPPSDIPPLVSIAGSNLISIGKTSSPLVLQSTGTLNRNGFVQGSTNAAIAGRQSALAAFADASTLGSITGLTGSGISSAYARAVATNTILGSTTSVVDQYFRNPTTGATLTSDVSRQLLRAARMIEARNIIGQNRQVFFVSQGGYDNHSAQTNGPGNTTTGIQANLFSDLAMALAGFYNAMKALGLSSNVTAFTMSDFGRIYKGNAQNGSDHAWGSNHLVIGGGLNGSKVLGAYPNPTLGGPDDISTDGRWLPTTAIEEYIGAIAQWHGVATADMGYVFPNWSTWSKGGRGPLGMFS